MRHSRWMYVVALVAAASDGYQVVLKSGTPLTFTTQEAVAVRL